MIALVAYRQISSEVLCFGSWRDDSLRSSAVLQRIQVQFLALMSAPGDPVPFFFPVGIFTYVHIPLHKHR